MKTNILKPKKLEKGDRVRVVAPSSPFKKANLLRGLKKLKAMGLKPVYRSDILRSSNYLAGNDERREKELLEAFADKKCKAVFCARGGYGATRILKRLDFKKIALNPKLFVGFSDITALHMAFVSRCGFATLHGPMAASSKFLRIKRAEEGYLKRFLFSARPLKYKLGKSVNVIKRGKAEGMLLGGNLTLIHSLVGTPYLPSFRGALLFLEDTAEEPYRIDRMLRHLFELKIFDGIRGAIIGRFEGDAPLTLKDKRLIAGIFKEYFGKLKGPVVYNFPLGHGSSNFPIPEGVRASLDTVRGTLVCEALVSD